jgi:hypothetical protein
MPYLSCLLLLVSSLLLSSQDYPQAANALFQDPYEVKLISSGANRPALNLLKDSLYVVLTMLHHGYSEATIAHYLRWSAAEFAARKNSLLKNDFLRNSGGSLRPTILIMSLAEGQQMRRQLAPMAAVATKLIKRKLPLIQQRYQQISAFRHRPFAESSFLVLSNVLLDNWQISAIETTFLHKERSLRHGKHYYAALLQKKANSPVEALGIYGNKVTSHAGYEVCRYGNVRYTPVAVHQTHLLEQAYQHYKTSVAREPFAYPVITPADEAALAELAGLLRPDLLALLTQNRAKLEEEYRKSAYAQEVSFEEYFIWWYHVFYTAVTDKLLSEKVLVLPPSRLAFYVLEE